MAWEGNNWPFVIFNSLQRENRFVATNRLKQKAAKLMNTCIDQFKNLHKIIDT